MLFLTELLYSSASYRARPLLYKTVLYESETFATSLYRFMMSFTVLRCLLPLHDVFYRFKMSFTVLRLLPFYVFYCFMISFTVLRFLLPFYVFYRFMMSFTVKDVFNRSMMSFTVL